jgi:hypothetical protein
LTRVSRLQDEEVRIYQARFCNCGIGLGVLYEDLN